MKKLAFLLLILCALAPACAAPKPSSPAASTTVQPSATPTAVSSATLARFRTGELRTYNGVNLDPAVLAEDNSIKGVQHVDIKGFTLAVDGLVQNPKKIAYDDVRAMPAETKLVTIHCVEGWDATILWKGVLMQDLLDAATVKPEAKTVIFHAVDGYTTSLPLKEILDKKLMLAYDANGIPLPPELGYPFIFVAEDKWGYKWARWVNRIELSSDTNYKGYWESEGFSNNGNVTLKP